jgi:hypothetical protein
MFDALLTVLLNTLKRAKLEKKMDNPHNRQLFDAPVAMPQVFREQLHSH